MAVGKRQALRQICIQTNYSTILTFTIMQMKKIQLSILAILAFIFTINPANACDLSNLTLNNVVSAGGGEYLITVTYCAGSGQNSQRYGGDQNSSAFGFQLVGATYSSTTPAPASLTSPTTGAIYDLVPYYLSQDWAIYDNNLNQWWACVNGGCGPVQSACVTVTLRTVGLPTLIRGGGAEAAGVVVPPYGCNGQPDMEVSPICFNFNVNAGADRTVYYGYAPQACTTLSAVAGGIAGPFTYLWSTGATTASINVCPSVTTTYTVTATAANGCVVSDQVVITSVNVICGNGKVNVCHSNVTKCVKTNLVAGHLLHGDRLGSCSNKTNEIENETFAGLNFYPNPASSSITISIFAETHGNATIEIFGINGAKISEVFSGSVEADTEMEFNQDLSSFPAGMYMVRLVLPDGKTEIKKLIVTK